MSARDGSDRAAYGADSDENDYYETIIAAELLRLSQESPPVDTDETVLAELQARYQEFLDAHPLTNEMLRARSYQDDHVHMFYFPDSPFCNFSRYPIPLAAVHEGWTGNATCAENVYQCGKFFEGNAEYARRIASALDGREAKRLGNDKRVPGYDPAWSQDFVALRWMVRTLHVKVLRHPAVAERLAETRGLWLVENTFHASVPDDRWGCGARGVGKNLLGIAWMIVRDLPYWGLC